MATGGGEDPGEGPSMLSDDEIVDCDVEKKMCTIRRMLPSNICEPRALTLDTRPRSESVKRNRREKFRSLYWKTSIRRQRQAAARGVPAAGDAVDGVSSGQAVPEVPPDPETYILSYLKEGGTEDEQAILEELRNFPEPLTLRRKVKKTLSKEAEFEQRRRRQTVSLLNQMSFASSLAARRAWNKFREGLRDWQLWNSALKTIEGSFGSGVGSYFRFLRSLVLLDAFVGAIMLLFVVVPHWIASANPDYSREEALNETSTLFAEKLILIREELDFRLIFGKQEGDFESPSFAAWDVLTGEGALRNTSLFYGGYRNQVVEIYDGMKYLIPHAYFFASVAAMLMAVLIICRLAASSFRQNFIARNGGRLAVVSLVFCGWDFNITSKSSAKVRHKHIRKDLEEYVDGLTQTRERWTRRRVLVSLCFNLAVLASIAAVACVFLLLLDPSLVLGENFEADGAGAYRDWVHLYVVPLLASSVMFFVPMLFSYLAAKEGYSNQRTQLYVTLLRSFLLQCAVLVAVSYYYVTLPGLEKARIERLQNHRDKTKRRVMTPEPLCWETTFGSMLYRLVVMDFVFFVLLGSLVDLLRGQIVRQIEKSREATSPTKKELLGSPVFDVARNTMNLIYNQTLVWLGLFYCPPLPLLVVLRYFITFFVNESVLLKLCDKKKQKTWRAAQTNSVFLWLAFFSCLAALAFLFYSMTTFEPSPDCGPLYLFNTTSDLFVSVIDDWDSSTEFFLALLVFLQGSWPKATAVMFLLACIYYMRETSEAHRQVTARLTEQLKEIRSDKQFYLKQIEKEYRKRTGSVKAATRDQLNNLGRRSFIRMMSEDSRLSASNSRAELLPLVKDDEGNGEYIPLQEMGYGAVSSQDVRLDMQREVGNVEPGDNGGSYSQGVRNPGGDEIPVASKWNATWDPPSGSSLALPNRPFGYATPRSPSMIPFAGSFDALSSILEDDREPPARLPHDHFGHTEHTSAGPLVRNERSPQPTQPIVLDPSGLQSAAAVQPYARPFPAEMRHLRHGDRSFSPLPPQPEPAPVLFQQPGGHQQERGGGGSALLRRTRGSLTGEAYPLREQRDTFAGPSTTAALVHPPSFHRGDPRYDSGGGGRLPTAGYPPAPANRFHGDAQYPNYGDGGGGGGGSALMRRMGGGQRRY